MTKTAIRQLSGPQLKREIAYARVDAIRVPTAAMERRLQDLEDEVQRRESWRASGAVVRPL